MTSDARTFPKTQGSERELLSAFLQYQRDTLEWKCTGLDEAQLKRAANPSSPVTLLGLLRHMTIVEYFWFGSILQDIQPKPGLYRDTSRDGDWRDLDSCGAEEVYGNWKDACAFAQQAEAGQPGLEALSARLWDNDEPVMVRWIMNHMIEEYARHLGHADFLRETIDGETGE